MNYRGHTVKLVQANTEAVTPFLISTAGLWDTLGQLFQNHFYRRQGKNVALVRCGRQYRLLFHIWPKHGSGHCRIQRPHGPAPQCTANGHTATGKARNIIKPAMSLLGVAREYRKRKIPIDNIIQDWNYWGGNKNWSGMFFDETKYPNPKEMVDMLHDMNFHMMISIWPGLGPNTEIFKEMDRKGYLYPTSSAGQDSNTTTHIIPTANRAVLEISQKRPVFQGHRRLVDRLDRAGRRQRPYKRSRQSMR